MNSDSISNLEISSANQKVLEYLGLTTISSLLNLDRATYKKIVDNSSRRRYFFDEIFIALKKKNLSYSFEEKYYAHLKVASNDLKMIKISDLEMSSSLRKYLERYDNIYDFFVEIACSEKKLQQFLYYNINFSEDYEWLYQLLDVLGNNGTILKLIIKQYQKTLQEDKFTLDTPLFKVLKKGKLLFTLNMGDVYTIGDLISLSGSDLLKFNGFTEKKVYEIMGTLYHYGYSLGQISSYRPVSFSLERTSLDVLNLSVELLEKLNAKGVRNVSDLIFNLDTEFLTVEEIISIKESLKLLGLDLNKPFLYTSSNSKAQKGLNLLQEKSNITDQIKQIDKVLRGIVPLTLEDDNARKLNSTSSKGLDSRLPLATKKYLSEYKSLDDFMAQITSNPEELKRFLYFNIDMQTNCLGFDKTFKVYGNDGVVLGMLIREYQQMLKTKNSLYRPLNKVFSKAQILNILLDHHLYFLGDLINLSREKLMAFEGFNFQKVNTITSTLYENGYFLEEETPYQSFHFDLSFFRVELLNLPERLTRKLKMLDIKSLQDMLLYPDLEYFSFEELTLIRKAFSDLGYDLGTYFTYAPGLNEALKYGNLYFEREVLKERDNLLTKNLEKAIPLLRNSYSSQDQMRKLAR